MSKLFTSYYDNMQQIKNADKNAVFISISGKVPKYFNGIRCKELAPKLKWWNEWHEKFKDNYESDESKSFYALQYKTTVLNTLNAYDLYNSFIVKANKQNIYLLCFETPDKFCHRLLVSKWFNKYGINCKEYIN